MHFVYVLLALYAVGVSALIGIYLAMRKAPSLRLTFLAFDLPSLMTVLFVFLTFFGVFMALDLTSSTP